MNISWPNDIIGRKVCQTVRSRAISRAILKGIGEGNKCRTSVKGTGEGHW